MSNKNNVFIPVYETNSIDAFIPEMWANESIAILIENMVAGSLVYRNFEPMIAQYGDVINTRKPASYTARRKTNADSVTIQNTTATNVPVKLDQHWHVSFLIRDGEESKSFKSLVSEYLQHAVEAIAQAIDKMILGQVAQFVQAGNWAGSLGGMTSSNGKDYFVDLSKVMDDNKAYIVGRNVIIGSATKATLLKNDDFTDASKIGDEGTAIRTASFGQALGFDTFMCQNMSNVVNSDVATDSITAAANAGATSIIVADDTKFEIGDFITVVGDMTPQLVTGVNAATSTITITPGLVSAAAASAVVKIYDQGAVNGAYAVGTSAVLNVDGLATQPVVGQIIKIDDNYYTVIEVGTLSGGACDLTLDRSLDAAVADNAIVSFLPSGSYNMAFTRDAIALVTRPLAQPMTGTGALSYVANYDGLSVRVTITYDGDKQGHLVTVDMLCGIKVLDTDLGAVLFA